MSHQIYWAPPQGICSEAGQGWQLATGQGVHNCMPPQAQALFVLHVSFLSTEDLTFPFCGVHPQLHS